MSATIKVILIVALVAAFAAVGWHFLGAPGALLGLLPAVRTLVARARGAGKVEQAHDQAQVSAEAKKKLDAEVSRIDAETEAAVAKISKEAETRRGPPTPSEEENLLARFEHGKKE